MCFYSGESDSTPKFVFFPTWDEVLNIKLTCLSIFFLFYCVRIKASDRLYQIETSFLLKNVDSRQ